MCAECTFIEEEVPMIFDDDKSDTPEDLNTPEKPTNLLAGQGCCGGSCCVGG